MYIEDRKKDMILVSGFNVYPNEVEGVAVTCPGVLEVAAVAQPDERAGEVVALFVVRKDPSLTEEALIEHCRKELTGYKVPKRVNFRDELPKTNVGKILRRELKDSLKPPPEKPVAAAPAAARTVTDFGMTDTNEQRNPEVSGLLADQDRCDHVGENRRRRGLDVVEPGCLAATGVFAAIMVMAVTAQIRAPTSVHSCTGARSSRRPRSARRGRFRDRWLGIGYPGGSLLLLSLLVGSLVVWRWKLGTVLVDWVSSPQAEVFYWVTIMFSRTLGTALGDWTADTAGSVTWGYGRFPACARAGRSGVPGKGHFAAALFWAAFVLTGHSARSSAISSTSR